jgi:hypothetical protein
MPWTYHSLDDVEVGWDIIPASSVPSNNMGRTTRHSGNCFSNFTKKAHETYFTSLNVRE